MLLIVLLPLLLLAEVRDTHALNQPADELQDFTCQKLYGYESVADNCDKYIECQDNKAYQQSCPDGLHFNSKAQWPYYPCGYPSEVQCEDGFTIQEPQPTAECEHQHGYFKAASGACDSYILCYEGIAKVMSCPTGLVFNPDTQVCDWPINVPQCNHLRALDSISCPASPAGEDGIISKYRYGKSCAHFVACQDGFPRFLSCGAGLHFDEQTESCVDSSNVVDCDLD